MFELVETFSLNRDLIEVHGAVFAAYVWPLFIPLHGAHLRKH